MIDKFDSLKGLISNTPLIEIDLLYDGKPKKIFAKAEYFNLSGSIKDRVALYILKKAYETGELKDGDTIVEATSGNTGISFCAIAARIGHPTVIYMPDWMSRERVLIMESFGAEVRLVSKEEGGFLGSIAKTEELYKKGGVFLPRQFSNEDNVNAHIEDTGAEIIRQLSNLGRTPDAVVAGVGTGGTIVGLGRAFKAVNPSAKVYPLEPKNSPTLSTGYKTGNHKIQGISDEFIPPIVHLDELDEVVAVDDVDSIVMSQMLSKKLGLGVGISSGANLLGAIMKSEELPSDATIVTVFADDNKKYLSTDYAKKWEVTPDMMTSKIELLGYKSYR